MITLRKRVKILERAVAILVERDLDRISKEMMKDIDKLIDELHSAKKSTKKPAKGKK